MTSRAEGVDGQIPPDQSSHDVTNTSPEPALTTYQDQLAHHLRQQRKMSRRIHQLERNWGPRGELDCPIEHQPSYLQPESLDRFKSQILPSVKREISRMSTLSLALDASQIFRDPSWLQDPSLKLKPMMDFVENIAQTFGQMITLISSSPKIANPDQFVDRESTGFRFIRLTRMSIQVISQGFKFFKTSHGLSELVCFAALARIKKSPEQKDADRRVKMTRKRLIRLARSCKKSLDWFIEWCGRSELSIIQDEWQATAALVDEGLRRLAFYEQECSEIDDDNPFYYELGFGGPQLELTRLMIPLLKLSRLFLIKLSKTTKMASPADQESSAPVFPRLKPHQFDSLIEVTRRIPPLIANLIDDLSSVLPDSLTEDEDEDEDDDDGSGGGPDNGVACFADSFSEFAECFRDSYELVLAACSELESSDHLKAWFITWNDQYKLATREVQFACAVYI